MNDNSKTVQKDLLAGRTPDGGAEVDGSSDAIVNVDLDGVVTYWNEAAEALYGHVASDAVGANLDVLAPPELRRIIAVLLTRVRHGDVVKRFLSGHSNSTGNAAGVSLTVAAIRDAGGTVIGLSVVANNIAEQMKTQATIRASESRYRRLFEAARLGIAVLDGRTGVLSDVNPSLCDLLGYEDDELLGKRLWEIAAPQDVDISKKFYAELQARNFARRQGLHLRNPSGNLITVDLIANGYDVDGVRMYQCCIRDIRDQKLPEAELELLRVLLDSTHDAVQVFSPDTMRVLDANQKAYHSLGYGRNEFLGLTLWDVDPTMPPEGERLDRTWRQTEPAIFESLLRRKDGSTFPVEVSTQQVTLDRPYILAVVRDLSKRKNDERALEGLKRALKTLGKGMSAVVHATSEDQLLGGICAALADRDDYPLVWVGYVSGDTVKPTAWAGPEAGQVDMSELTASTQEGGPVSTCLRTGKMQVTRDQVTHAIIEPWWEVAARFGCKASIVLPLRSPSGVLGVLTVCAQDLESLNSPSVALLGEMADALSFGLRALRAGHAHARESVERERSSKLEQSLIEAVESLAEAMERRDPYTAGHQRRARRLAVAIACELSMDEDFVAGLSLAARIYEIGKIAIPVEILAKPDRLTPSEFALVKNHPESGYRILEHIQFPWPIAEMIRQHHERLDGSGYPQGLTADQILPGAKILAVADVVDAVASPRSYRSDLGLEGAMGEIRRGRGSLYDANAVDACLRLFLEKEFELDGNEESAD